MLLLKKRNLLFKTGYLLDPDFLIGRVLGEVNIGEETSEYPTYALRSPRGELCLRVVVEEAQKNESYEVGDEILVLAKASTRRERSFVFHEKDIVGVVKK